MWLVYGLVTVWVVIWLVGCVGGWVLAWFSGFLWDGAMCAFGWVLGLVCVDALIVICGLLGFGFGVGVICVFSVWVGFRIFPVGV